jgi:release factor glutamine methyltransferase
VLAEVRDATRVLAAAGVASPAHDAEELAAHVLGLSRSRLVLLDRLPADAADRYAELVRERAARVPLQHLTGVAGFRRLDLAVGPGVFVPRPETEVLVQWALDSLAGAENPLVVDLCSGSGAIALAIADELPGARVHAVELEEHALAWAFRNVQLTGLAVTLHQGDVADASLLASLAGTVDLVTANPPYIPIGAGVEREVAEHDPPAALWGGEDGLATVRMVERTAHRLLRPGGLLGVEHADRQGESVPAVFPGAGWTEVEDHPDLVGRPRFTTARRR